MNIRRMIAKVVYRTVGVLPFCGGGQKPVRKMDAVPLRRACEYPKGRALV